MLVLLGRRWSKENAAENVVAVGQPAALAPAGAASATLCQTCGLIMAALLSSF